ncbi:hypothetical protein KDW_51410 [Dictyobacter vulcani]|uniref:TIR domain-containing protein n=1 Tax=Dictyobacter vulcani TaxID=2607529 RepID=A0A5J4KXW5_9CHLR|nr:CHAT domain-containing protein [Dictyobacter vulcani]GER90979.1 hypothetical protein KDW_51410 [Dictyobacter vulcani]
MDEKDIVRILFLAASPTNTVPLELDKEISTIRKMIRDSTYRNHFAIEDEWAVLDDDLLNQMNRNRPHVVHFSGHGTASGELIFEGNDRSARPVPTRAIQSLFSNFKDTTRLVILNACNTHQQAQMIAKEIDCVIGMSQSIGDTPAIVFIAAFYAALGFGSSIQDAFNQALNQLQIKNIPAEDIPRLFTRRGVNAKKITWRDLIKPAGGSEIVKLIGKRSGAKDRPVSIFVSYASEDERIYARLDKHFATMKRNGTISVLRFDDILAGQSSMETVTEYLNEADIVLLLISPDFMASDNLYENELKPAFKRRAQGLTSVIPILVRPTTGWNEDRNLHGLWVLPVNKTPVSRWDDIDSALLSVAKEVRRVVDTIKANQA